MKADIIIHWGELQSWLGQAWAKNFTHDTVDMTFPRGTDRNYKPYYDAIRSTYPYTEKVNGVTVWRPIKDALKRRGIEPGGARVGIIGFSETCIGVRVLLSSADAGIIDFIYPNDGIHAGVETFATFAKLAAFGVPSNSPIPPTGRLMVVTHSQTAAPPGVYSTTQSTGMLINAVSEFPVAAESIDIPELTMAQHSQAIKIAGVTYNSVPAWYQFKVGNFYALGYKNLSKPGGTSDHIYQSKVIGPRVMRNIIIPRWNDNEPGSGSCVVA
jgi:hypothetical protein